jgi:cell division protein ZapA
MVERRTKVTVEILGQQYPIKGDAEAERITRVAGWLNDQMKKISQSNSRLSSHQVAIMTAMNLADDYLKLEADYRELMQMVKQQNR